MRHIEATCLQAYVNHGLSEKERDDIELHLDTCDQCFDMYLTTIEQSSCDSSLSGDFTDRTVEAILDQQVIPGLEGKRTETQKRKKTFVHYALAAGLTLVLMGSGVFEQMLTVIDEDSFEKRPSISENIMNETDTLFKDFNQELGEKPNE